MFAYKPKKADFDESISDSVGYTLTDFDVLAPDPKYSFTGRAQPGKDTWPFMELRHAPPIGDLPRLMQNLIDSMWKFAEPAKDAPRGPVTMGTRGQAGFQPTDTYHPQVIPTNQAIPVKYANKSAFASDWKVFETIDRINAVTFRGDTRPPIDVITHSRGFYPPNSRTDAYYLEKNIYEAFEDYLQRRYQRALTQQDFLQAVRSAAPSDDDKKLLVDFMMWRKICEREAMHMGRMVANECLKGYISTSRSIDTAIQFGTRHNSIPGWLYVTMVHGAFIVPFGAKALWGSGEAEIAQWGPVPAEQIVGYCQLVPYKPVGSIYIRHSFRKNEPKAFEYIFKVMSGMTP
jgi:hypothetical protein